MKLVLVESPTKAKTIGKFLGRGYKIEPTYGHVRDLPKSRLGIDPERDFEPHYIVPMKSRKRVNELKKEAAKAEEVILASDEDREGEAIAWHLTQALGLGEDKKTERIVFHEITKPAILEALKTPRPIKMSLVDAQQARRILDRLVGYKLSPFLWKKVMSRLSAGRVQSAALRLIVEREKEIKAFNPEEYWTVSVWLQKGKEAFKAELVKIGEEVLTKTGIKNEATAGEITADLNSASFGVLKATKKEVRRHPLPPFTTSTLQQESAKKLRFSAERTMRVAQSLYDRGFITYMRTDSVNLSAEAVAGAREWLEKNYGKGYLLESPRKFKVKSRLAQEAHEAIRPTNPALPSLEAEAAEKKLYEFIWRRFMASQMPAAVFDSTSVEVEAQGKEKSYLLKANGLIQKFDGFLRVWPIKFDDSSLPDLLPQDHLGLKEIVPLQHFTEPPARYNDASLIKTLEENGVGRPSTYAPIISLIIKRNYAQKNENRRFVPTEIGELVSNILSENFPEIVDVKFTAKMEDNLDKIADGEIGWSKVIKDFYNPFTKDLDKKYEEVKNQKPAEEKTDEKCELCGRPMVIKYGRFGRFMACSGYPDCKNTKRIIAENQMTGLKCPKCSEGNVILKRTKRGRNFYGCDRWPKCDFASWKKPEE